VLLEPRFPIWRPYQDYVWHVLVWIKRIFYQLEECVACTDQVHLQSANPKAAHLYKENREQFVENAHVSAVESASELFGSPHDDHRTEDTSADQKVSGRDSDPRQESIEFEEWSQVHQAELDRVLQEGLSGGSGGVMRGRLRGVMSWLTGIAQHPVLAPVKLLLPPAHEQQPQQQSSAV